MNRFPTLSIACVLLAACGSSTAPATTSQAESVPVPASPPPVSAAIDQQELTAVGLDYFEASWRTAARADSMVCLFPPQGPGRCERQETGQVYHLVRVTGLQPGTAYAYWLISNGARAEVKSEAPPSLTVQDADANPGSFTTLAPPPGKHVADVALLSDLHVGETCSGQLFALAGQSFPPCTMYPGTTDGSDGHGRRMLAGAAVQVRALNPALVLVLGDLTNNSGYPDMLTAKALLDGIGLPYAVLRGNHDRPAQNGTGEAESCGAAKDCYSTVFRPDHTMRIQPLAVETHDVRFLMLDANDTSGTGDLTDAGQQAWTGQQLRDHPRQRTFILSHEPAGTYSNATTYIPGFGVTGPRGGDWLHQVVLANPQVTATLAGHTHRNLLGYDPDTGRFPWIEIGANKEYAAGFTMLRIYEGGFVREYHRTDCAADDNFCREWTSLSRGQMYGGQYPYMLGQLSARAFTYVDDCSHPTPRSASLPWSVDGGTGQDTGDCRGNILFPAED
jgi:3',5'-cyclic AMP phosphodiesterase CpdA